jgi:hypothetical protein
MNKSRPTQLKRQRERAQTERRQLKAQRRLEVKAQKKDSPRMPGDEDPDIAGIRPGPQPSPYDDFPGDLVEEKAPEE